MLSVYLTRVRIQYVYDNQGEKSAIVLQVIVEGEQSSGKSFARYIMRTLMKPFIERDSEMRAKEQEYAALKRRQGKKDAGHRRGRAVERKVVCQIYHAYPDETFHRARQRNESQGAGVCCPEATPGKEGWQAATRTEDRHHHPARNRIAHHVYQAMRCSRQALWCSEDTLRICR